MAKAIALSTFLVGVTVGVYIGYQLAQVGRLGW